MADRYWVGGTAIWNTTNTVPWSATSGGSGGASVPTASDNVIFDQASTYTVTFTNSRFAANFTVSAGNVTFTGTGGLSVAGNLSITGVTWNATGETIFTSTTTGKTITTNGTTINCNFTLNGVGGGWSLGSTLTLGLTKLFALTNGALSLNGFDLTCGTFSSSNSNTRSIAFGSNNINVNNSAASSVGMDIATADNFTWSGTGGFIADTTINRTHTFGVNSGGTVSNAINLTFTGTSNQVQSVSGGSWLKKLDYGNTPFVSNSGTFNIVSNLTLSGNTSVSSATYTGVIVNAVGNCTLICNGKSISTWTVGAGFTMTLGSSGGFANCTHTTGTLDMAGYIFQGTGTSTWTTGVVTNLGEFGSTGTFNITGQTLTLNAGQKIKSASATLTTCTIDLTNGGEFRATGTITINGGSFTYGGTGTFVALSISQNTGNPTVTFNKDFASSGNGTYSHATGALILGDGVNLNMAIYTASGTSTRSVAFGSTTAGNITLNSTTAGATVINVNDTTGWSYTGPGGFRTDAQTTRTIGIGITNGSISIAPNVTVTGNLSSTITISSGSYIKNFDFGGNSLVVPSTTINITGNLSLSNGNYTAMRVNMLGTGTITQSGRTLGILEINTPGTVTITSQLGVASAIFTTGTFDMAGFSLVSTGTIDFTAGTITNINAIQCTSWNNAGDFSFAGAGGTLTPSTNFTMTSGSFTYGGSATLSPVASFVHAGGTVTFNKDYALTATGNYNLTGSATASSLILNANLTTGSFTSTNSNTRSIQFNTFNIILAHTTANFTNLNMPNAGNFSCTGTGGFTADLNVTRTFTCGTTTQPTIGPNLSLTGSSIGTVTSLSTFRNLNFTGSSYTIPTNVELRIQGTLTLSSGGTFTTLTVSCITAASASIQSNGKSLAALNVTTTGTVTLLDALTLSGTLVLSKGTISTNYNITCSRFNGNGIVNSNPRQITGGNITLTVFGDGGGSPAFDNDDTYGSTVVMSNVTVNMTSAYAKTFNGKGGTYKSLNQGGMGTLTITGTSYSGGTGNTFSGLTNTVYGSYIKFPNNITTTFTSTGFGLTGLQSNPGPASAYPVGAINFPYNSSAASSASLRFSSNNSAFQFGTGDWTFETWVYKQVAGASSNDRTIFDMRTSASNVNPLIYLDTSGNFVSIINGTSINSSGIFTTLDDTWYHLAVCRISGVQYMYINGTLTGTPIADTNNYVATSIPSIGQKTAAQSGGNFFVGLLSNLRVVKGVGVYTGNFTVPTGPLAATQSASTNIAAITGTQTSLLLNSPTGSNNIVDSSTNAWSLTNANTAASSLSPFYTYITSSTSGSTTTLTKPSGTNFVKRLYVKDVTVTGGASWYAGSTGINGGNTSGWSFIDYVAVTIGSFSSFFFF